MDTGLIQLEPREGGVLEAHIGMLKSHHTYSAEIPVAHSLGEPGAQFSSHRGITRENIISPPKSWA